MSERSAALSPGERGDGLTEPRPAGGGDGGEVGGSGGAVGGAAPEGGGEVGAEVVRRAGGGVSSSPGSGEGRGRGCPGRSIPKYCTVQRRPEWVTSSPGGCVSYYSGCQMLPTGAAD